MRTISAAKIRDAVSELCLRANFELRSDVLARLKAALRRETNRRSRKILSAIIENAAIAKKEGLAICQDTGMPLVFLEIGQGVRITGDLKSAVNQGVASGYRKGYFRESIVPDPLGRGRSGYAPALVHTDIVRGSRIKIAVLPKGFGCENKSQLRMFNPTAGLAEVKKFIIEAVKRAGPDACPPYIVGVGVGGTADYACLLAKKALLRSVGHRPVDPLAAELLTEMNKLNIGPMGLGGKVTVLAVNIERFPTHIAGLPVAVNISCHALRSAAKVL